MGFIVKVTFEQKFEGDEGRSIGDIGKGHSGLRGWSTTLTWWKGYTHQCVQASVDGHQTSHKEPLGLGLEATVQMRAFTQKKLESV